MSPTATQELGRLRWRCRRGMKELDVLLARYVEEHYSEAPPSVQRAFIELLESPDPVIYAYCMGRMQPPTPLLSSVIERITRHAPRGT
jgi:antitoxin CptB